MSYEATALVVEVRRIWPKLTPRLCTSEGLTLAIVGGLLGQAELDKEFFEEWDRLIELLLCPDRTRLDVEWVETRRLPCFSASIRREFGWRRLRPTLTLRVPVLPFLCTVIFMYSPRLFTIGFFEAR